MSMTDIHETATNRILVVDDDVTLIEEYLRCLGEDYEPDSATTTLSELEKVLFGDETDESGAARFSTASCTQGEPAVDAVREAIKTGKPYSIVFLDIRMPPGMDGIEAAKQIRALDPDVNIVIVTGSMSAEVDNLDAEVPPADKIFFFKKPFHAAECRQLAAALCGKWHADMALRRANEDLEQRVVERTAALHKLAYYDPITRLPNQLLLLDEMRLCCCTARYRSIQLPQRNDGIRRRHGAVALDWQSSQPGALRGTRRLVCRYRSFRRRRVRCVDAGY
jgi:CheY-like chemotaxis protein